LINAGDDLRLARTGAALTTWIGCVVPVSLFNGALSLLVGEIVALLIGEIVGDAPWDSKTCTKNTL
jgi:hypothetical protein